MNLKDILSVALSATVIAWLALPAQGQCNQWDVSGKWTFEQGNGMTIEMDLRQYDTALSGRAEIVKRGPIAFGRKVEISSGTVGGSINGNDFLVYVGWDNGSTGVYQGTINTAGRIAGSTHDKTKPGRSAPWFSLGMMKCKSASAPQPSKPVIVPAAPKPVKTLGRSKTPASPPAAESNPGGQPGETKLPDPPYILAAPNVVTLKPGEMIGHTTLIWDAGPDHPYAEVWLKINDADEKFVLEKGKGQLAVDLTKGRTYTYILTDSGKTLATVSLLAQ